MTITVSLEELEERYPSEEFRSKLFRLTAIVDILRDSIITGQYKVSQALHEAVALTEYGRRVTEQLTRKGVSYPEGKILCLLEIAYSDFLVDIQETDQDALVSAINDQLKRGLLRFPFIFGRELYDKFYARYGDTDEVYHLNPKETQELLEGTAQGVYQHFDLVMGPLGILPSLGLRFFTADKDVPLRHCEDFTCNRVHRVSLATSYEASINKNRKEIGKILDKEGPRPSAWAGFINKIGNQRLHIYRDWSIEPLIPLIGDALIDVEMRQVVSWLLDNTNGQLRKLVGPHGMTGASDRITQSLDRATMLQMILTCADESISTCLDSLIFDEIIRMPPEEIRTAKVNAGIAFGPYQLQGEMSRFGVRVQANVGGVSSLRLRRLIEQMYRLDDDNDRQELEWRLRDQPADSLEARLEHYIQSRSPEEMLRNLVLARKSNVIVASEKLTLIDGVIENDDLLIKTILWKLGFSGFGAVDPHGPFWELYDEMLQLTRQSPLGQLAPDRDQIRGVAANFFVTLEEILDTSITYTTWALLNDHYIHPRPFVYAPEACRAFAYDALNANEDPNGEYTLKFSDKNSLYVLMRGFQRLSALLEDREIGRDNFKRRADQTPDWVMQQSLQRFPFEHTIPFLDLLPECRSSVRSALVSISQRLVGASINDARNEWLHGRRTAANLERLRASLEVIREAVTLIEDFDFTCQQFTKMRSEYDGHGRGTIFLANAKGREIAFFRPSQYAWLQMPSLQDSQYIMASARFAEPSEALRFTPELDSDYTKMWSDFPLRPQALGRKLSANMHGVDENSRGKHTD